MTAEPTPVRTVALVAHDARKDALVAWAKARRGELAGYRLFATGTTGARLIEATGLDITPLRSGPLGGDAQIGALIAEGKLDALIFFIDPLSAMPHDVDVKSLLRLATLYNTLLALNEATANAIFNAARKEEMPS